MKKALTLLVLLSLAGVAGAQEENIRIIGWTASGDMVMAPKEKPGPWRELPKPQDIFKSEDVSALIDSILIAKWDAYKAECWADSTHHEAWTEYGGGSDLVARIIRHPAYYTHRPATFDGFMEFLRRKKGEKE